MKVALVLAALLLAGCASDEVAPAAATPEASATPTIQADAQPAAAGALAEGARVVYFTPEGGFADAPPAAESLVSPATPVQSPATGASLDWAGRAWLPERGTLTLTLFVTSSSASVPARTLPGVPYPGIGVYVTAGNASAEASADGPALVRSGEVQTVVVEIPWQGEAGEADVAIEVIPYYSHVAAVAELQLALGPEHPMALSVAAAS